MLPKRSLSSPSISIDLWKVLALSLSLLIVMTVGLVGVLSFKNSQQAIQQLAVDRMNQTGDHIQQYFNDYLEEPRQINQTNVNSVRYGDLNLQDLLALEKRLFGELQQFETVSTVFYANPQGIVRGAARDTGQPLIVTADYSQAIAFSSYTVDDNGNKLQLVHSIPGIDVRRDRPWYKLAVETGKPGWTPVFQIAHFNILTINAFHPVYDEQDGMLLGVFSVNLPLKQISQFLRLRKSDQTAALFVVDTDGYLIGSATDLIPFTTEQRQGQTLFKRMRPQNSENSLIRETGQYLNTHFPNWDRMHTAQQLDFRGNDDRYYVQTRPYRQGNGLNWLVVEVVPESSLMGSITAKTYRTMALCIVFLMMAMMCAILIARWITQPLERLNINAQRIAHGDFQPVVLDSPITETRSLAHTFNQMAQQLRSSFTEMRSLNEQLKAKEALLQDALRQSEAQFREAFDTAAIGMGILSITGQFLRVNPSLCQMFGYSAEDFLTLKLQELNQTEDSQRELALRQQLLNDEIPYYHLEQRYRHRQGWLIWGLLSTAIVRDSQHQPLYFVLQIQNISRQKQAETELQQANLELQELVRIDPLTQIFNRRWFAHQLEQEWRRAARDQLPLSIILLDVDCFKHYNDCYGHPAGDRCLVAVAQALKQGVQRPLDLVARYGGEEFVIILANTPHLGAIAVAQKIQQAIKELAIPHAASTVSRQVTVSLGLATTIPDTETPSDAIVAAADQALYRAKKQGRDCFVAVQDCNRA